MAERSVPIHRQSAADALLRLEGLCFGAAGRALSAPVDLVLSAGELLVLLGPNGAGKTTLFRTMLGLLPAVDGVVLWQGRPVRDLPPNQLARLVSYVPQSPGAAFDFTVHDYVMMGRLGPRGALQAPSVQDDQKVDEALERLGLNAFRMRPLSHLSGGEQQLAAIARALAQGSAAIFLDEPAASLDLANQSRVLALLNELVRDGLAIVYSTHDPNHALVAASSVLLLAPGQHPLLGAASDVLTSATLSQTFDVPVEQGHTVSGRRLFSVAAAPGRRDEEPRSS
jgi:iron complex transport system ATP-binding protein